MTKSSSYRNARSTYAPSGLQGQEPFFAPNNAVQTKQEEPFFQTSLSIGKANDKYEIEADRVADKVVQRLSTPIEDENFSTNDQRIRNDRDIQEKPEVQLKCSHCEQEEHMQKKEEAVQKKDEASPGVSSMIDNTRGKGQSMPESTRYQMEAAFGTSFHDVNIHTDADAVSMNRQLGAQAFAHGNDIYFNTGKYNPDSTSGQHLLAHELTHVVQQGGGAYREKIQRKPAKGKPKEPAPMPPAAAPELSAIPHPLSSEGCSDVVWNIHWDLSEESSSKGGWIVQEITFVYNAYDCNLAPIFPNARPIHYYEAWRVEPNSTKVTPGNLDTFHFRTHAPDHTVRTSGAVAWSGIARYHDNVGENELPGHMTSNNAHTGAGELRASTTDPQVGGNVSAPVPHQLAYHWSCCGEHLRPNIIDVQKPS